MANREVRERSSSFYNNYSLLGLDIFMDSSLRYSSGYMSSSTTTASWGWISSWTPASGVDNNDVAVSINTKDG